MTSPCDLTAAALLAAYRARQLSPVDVVRACLDRAAAQDKRLNAVLCRAGEMALQIAQRAETRWKDGSAGLLEGIPFGLKDVIETGDMPTTYGTKGLVGPRRDAEVVRRLKAAGAIPLFKLQTNEIAFGAVQNPHNGSVANPWNAARMAGGSSSGSGAAVAAGYVPLALGTDTGGSVRSPSAYCGITGLKPTSGLLPVSGISAVAPNLDAVGPMARSAEDIGLAMAALTATGSASGSSAAIIRTTDSLKGIRIGVVEGWAFDVLEPDVDRLSRAAIQDLARLGAQVSPAADTRLDLAWQAGWIIMIAESSGEYVDHLRHGAAVDPSLRVRLWSGTLISSTDYLAARRVQDRLVAGLPNVFAQHDVLVLPTSVTAAPGVAATAVKLNGKEYPRIDIATRLTIGANVLGVPALTLPCGFDRDGLPVGLQFLGPRNGEAKVIAVAQAYQAATDFHQLRPAAHA